MSTAVINLSPHGKNGASGVFTDTLLKKLENAFVLYVKDDFRDELALRRAACAKKIIMVFPLYLDSAPSHALMFLDRLAHAGIEKRTAIYCVINCGFYENSHCENAVRLLRNFCAQTGARYSGSVCFGGGALVCVLNRNAPIFLGYERKTMDKLARAVNNAEFFGDKKVKVPLPRWCYKAASHMSFYHTARKNKVRL